MRTGISTNGKLWFTESLHFTPTSSKRLSMIKIREVFEITTHNNALELVFEQLERQQFTFQLVITPFIEIGLNFLLFFNLKIENFLKNFLRIPQYYTYFIKILNLFMSFKH
jgi:hypothetical protein